MMNLIMALFRCREKFQLCPTTLPPIWQNAFLKKSTFYFRKLSHNLFRKTSRFSPFLPQFEFEKIPLKTYNNASFPYSTLKFVAPLCDAEVMAGEVMHFRIFAKRSLAYALVAELADALDLGSSPARGCRFKSCRGHPN